MRRFLIVLAACIVWINASAQPNPAPKARHKFIVICHRGDHVKYPENTLAAYAEAINNGADYVEIDLRTTKDSALVSMHDNTVNRMTNAKGLIKDMTLDEIEQLQVKSRDSLDKKVYRVPTFEEILKLCKDKIYIYIDFKNASVPATYAMLKKYGMEKQVLVYINAIQQYIDWRHVAPDMPLMFSMPNSAKDVEGMKTFINQVKPDILDGGWKEYSKEMVQFANEQNIPVWPDIQSMNEDKDWDTAIALGFKGMQTDHPAAFIKYLEEKGLR
ncbi:MAG: glycerophosphodiester phosphodiesterase family protein [Bacteroidetes bacterium]|jgi:glycerophosphoryl diester phosphodiesterase|nr:glycerophosphodiester phosphodiesterase family protein [Bacteroidota bacterium]